MLCTLMIVGTYYLRVNRGLIKCNTFCQGYQLTCLTNLKIYRRLILWNCTIIDIDYFTIYDNFKGSKSRIP